MTTTPIEGDCDHCKQPRALWLYEKNHLLHLGGFPLCTWCRRRQQPLLCTRCWSAERLREEREAITPGEYQALQALYARPASQDGATA